MSEIIRSGKSAFVPRARLLKLLGGELIRDEVMAINELVKNAHDADASRVSLKFLGVTDTNGEILIEDDGHGMDVDILLENWMQPAGSTKSREDRHYTPGGRRVLGEKGVGRFAIDRLGRNAELVSRRSPADTELVANFDWDEFDDETRLLSDVESSWSERVPVHFERTGTLLKVSGLRAPWTEKNFRKLTTRLHRLLNPFQNGHNFSIEIHSDEFPDYQRTIDTSFLESSPYRVSASFDGVSMVNVALNGKDAVAHRWNGAGELDCGPVTITLHGFDLDSESIAKVGPPAEVRGWLREWSGISIYRDGFRVLPYGEPDDDWLRLDQRRVNNPVVRLSNNQLCGFIEISRDGNPELSDQTNRGGLMETRAYEDLRRLVLFVIQILEAERQSTRHPVETDARAESSLGTGYTDEKSIISEIRAFSGSLDRQSSRQLSKLLSRLEETTTRQQLLRRTELSSYADLAALGHSTGYFQHSLRPQLAYLTSILKDIRDGRRQDDEHPHSIGMAEDCLEEMRETLDTISRVAPAGKRMRRTIDLTRELDVFERSSLHLVAASGLLLELNVPDRGLVRADLPPETLHQVLYILLLNSLEWIETHEQRRISVTAQADSKHARVRFQDNGPGIPREYADRIFEPRFSLKETGRGMGLVIAKHLLSGHNATLTLIQDRRRNGATFEIAIPLKRAKATKP